MSKDRFTEKWEEGTWEIEVSADPPFYEVRNSPVTDSSGCTRYEMFLSGPAVDRLAQYEDLIFSPETLKAIIAEWKEWADAKNDGRLQILPVKPGDTLYMVNGPCVPPFGTCPFDGGYGTYRCGLGGEDKCKAYISEVTYGDPMLNRIGDIYFATKKEAEEELEKRWGKEKSKC